MPTTNMAFISHKKDLQNKGTTGVPEADQKCGGKHTVAGHICIAKN